jgi:trimethylamine:corrinoid methyltransferase-like protein
MTACHLVVPRKTPFDYQILDGETVNALHEASRVVLDEIDIYWD